MTTLRPDREARTVLDELGDAARDYWSERYFGSTEESSRRAEKDWHRALDRVTDAVDAAKKAQQDGLAVPGNTPDGRVAIMRNAKRSGSSRRLTFDNPLR